MTATIFLDPVAAVAATVLRLPIPFDLTCPNDCARFGNQVPGWTVGSAWDWVPCPSCNGTGQRVIDGRWNIATTSQEPREVEGVQLCYFPASECVVHDEWIGLFDGHKKPIPLYVASMIGSANLRALPIVDESEGVGPGVWVVPDRKSRGIYPKLLLATEDESAELVDISAALVFGKFEPGGVALYATDFTQSVECPECHGYCCLPIRLGSDGLFGGGGRCPSCLGTGRLSCPFPVDDAPDRPCVQP